MFCPYCGTPMDDDALTCNACNSPVEPLEKNPEPAPENQPETAAQQETFALFNEEAPAPKKRSPLLRILLTTFGIAAALTAVVWLAIFLLPILAGKGPATGLYIKDNELFTTRLSKLQPWQVTDKLIDGSNSQIGSQDKNTYAGLLADYTYLTRDGRTIFYPDKFTPGDEGVTIFYRNIKNPEEDPQKLDSNIFQYTVSPDGSRVVYLKSDGTLYRYNTQEKTKVASGIATKYAVPHFYTSEDCKNLIYMVAKNGAYTVYAQAEGGERTKLASDCLSIQYINNACNTLYYLDRDNDLCKVTVGQEKETIAYNVSNVFCIYESGEIYYTTCEDNDVPTITPGQFVEDDVKTDTSREHIRQSLASATPITIQYASAVCYYDGKESHTLAENCILNADFQEYIPVPFSAAPNAATLVYSYFTITDVERVKLSQVTNYNELTEKIAENISKAHKIFVAAKGTATQMHPEQTITANDIGITDDGKTGYYLVKKADEQLGTLYKFAIADGIAQKAEAYASDVYQFDFLDSNTILYYCDYSEQKASADMYVNQVLVEYDANRYLYDKENKLLYYFTDWDKDHMNGTLKVWEDGESARIADEVYTFQWFDDEVLYITDYNTDKGRGTLYLYQNNESYEVDSDVSYIIGSNDDFGFVFRKTVLKY